MRKMINDFNANGLNNNRRKKIIIRILLFLLFLVIIIGIIAIVIFILDKEKLIQKLKMKILII